MSELLRVALAAVVTVAATGALLGLYVYAPRRRKRRAVASRDLERLVDSAQVRKRLQDALAHTEAELLKDSAHRHLKMLKNRPSFEQHEWPIADVTDVAERVHLDSLRRSAKRRPMVRETEADGLLNIVAGQQSTFAIFPWVSHSATFVEKLTALIGAEGEEDADEEPMTPSEAASVAPLSARSLDRALAELFIRLGPPPEPSATDYAPASNGGGGAQQ